MHLHSRCLPRPSVSSPLDNKAQPMANTNQLLVVANPPSPAAPPILDAERSLTIFTAQETIPRTTAPKIRDLDACLNAINMGVGVPVTVDALVRQTEPPFTARILRARVSSRFKLPTQLGVRKKNASHLFTIHQKETERLKDYVKQFNQAILEVEDPSDKVVLTEIKHKEFVKWPRKIKTDPSRRNKGKYCEFHWDHRHNTDDCFQLKEHIADLIKKGFLRKYVANRQSPISPERRYGDNRPTTGDIQVIHRGFGSNGCTSSSRKRHVRNAQGRAEEEIYNLSSPTVEVHPPITFNNDDLRGLHLPHDDALVVAAVISNFNVQRILVDNESSADILFTSAVNKMKIGLDKLHSYHIPLVGFWGEHNAPTGMDKVASDLGS
ncbi:hypothetical protein Acr_01g0009490 [Actinidia rufa]|uniref:Retrotransposon gag domain-containing protein n=1 Tax=Actinidia rufa TaxID=165716 RepID=A0A7J0E3Z6_9ERIC|nr:hypothetical protein Acr_01g0009490 [Actinidia rufa]